MAALRQAEYVILTSSTPASGNFVTGGNLNEVIVSRGMDMNLYFNQTWSVIAAKDKKNMYEIVRSDVFDTVAGFGTADDKLDDNVSVVLSDHPQSWRMVKSEAPGATDAYEIHADTCDECAKFVISIPGVGNELKLVKLSSVKSEVPYFTFYDLSDI